MFSEEFQRDYYARINAEIDKRPWFIGEQLWNFADFATFQGIIRVEGNRKGILTRDRQPKMAAHWLHDRWTGISDCGYTGQEVWKPAAGGLAPAAQTLIMAYCDS